MLKPQFIFIIIHYKPIVCFDSIVFVKKCMKLNILFSSMCYLNVINSTSFDIYDCCKARSNINITNYVFYYNDSDLTLLGYVGSGPLKNTTWFS